MNAEPFAAWLDTRRGQIHAALDALRPNCPPLLLAALRYSLLAGGKRLRPLLLLAAYEAGGGRDPSQALPFACALEMIHTYSLIHDDLPCMDNDALRRGLPTNHVVYGEAMALLAGDGLLNLAYEVMAQAVWDNPGPGPAGALQAIAGAAGVTGMVGGQALDMAADKTMSQEAVLWMYSRKTAELFRAALCAGLGLALGGRPSPLLEQFHRLGTDLGVAFQIKDDLLDLAGDPQTMGKPAGSDARNDKATFAALFGRAEAEAELARRKGALGAFVGDLNAPMLRRLIEGVLD
jgi:geranylgeranyl diphosphate synthase type II